MKTDWVAEVMENNIANVVRHQPSPQMKALIAREGGLDVFAARVRDFYIADRQAAALE